MPTPNMPEYKSNSLYSEYKIKTRTMKDDCIVWNARNTVFVSKRSVICVQAVYFLHSMRPSVPWLNSRWWLAACDWVMSALSAVLSTHVGCRIIFIQNISWTEKRWNKNLKTLIKRLKTWHWLKQYKKRSTFSTYTLTPNCQSTRS